MEYLNQIIRGLVNDCNDYLKAHKKWDKIVYARDIIFDDSRAWGLYIPGEKLGLDVKKFGAYRNYLGGGVRGPIESNGRLEDDTMELAKKFSIALDKIEKSINEGYEDEEEWNKPTGVLLN